ncbi:hypothetical protein EMMF5_002204 [Cystobasidiomycetes sp. EMM_F5]
MFALRRGAALHLRPQQRVSQCSPLAFRCATRNFVKTATAKNDGKELAQHHASPPKQEEAAKSPVPKPEPRENIYTIPNLLTVSRIVACPFLGYAIVQGDFKMATGLLVYAGATDWIDGYLARRHNMGTVFGSILDPAADKFLMTTLTVALAINGLLPLPLAILIIGRDVALSISAFYFRYISLPKPKTFKRYWDFSIPSAEVKPTQISKYNTFLQLVLMGVTTVSPLLPFDLGLGLTALQYEQVL